MTYKTKLTELANALNVDETLVEQVDVIIQTAIAEAVSAKETEMHGLVEQAAQEAATAIQEARVAMESELAVQAKEFAREFVAENKQRFVDTAEYDRMSALVESLQDAFAGILVEEKIHEANQQLTEQLHELEQEVAQLQEAQAEFECTQELQKLISENSLSDLQTERVCNLITFTKPTSVSEFVSIAEHIIQEVKGKAEPETPSGDGENGDDPKTVNENIDAQSNVLRYLNAALSTGI